MKFNLILGMFFLVHASYAVADGGEVKESLDCGVSTGLSIAGYVLWANKTVHGMDSTGWVSIYDDNVTRAEALAVGIDFVIKKRAIGSELKTGLDLMRGSLGSIINRPTRSGDSTYWVSLVEQQRLEFEGIFENLKKLRAAACKL